MSVRSILQVFSDYQKARTTFIQTVAELSTKPQNIELLHQGNVFELLKPLLKDVCPQIRQCAAIALGRLIEVDQKSAKKTIDAALLPLLMDKLDEQNKYFKKSVLYMMRCICKHDEALAKAVVDEGGLSTIVYLMGDFEPMVKESALWAVGYIARHNKDLAQAVADAGAIPNVVLCLQEPELAMKQVAANVINDIVKHSIGLAQNVMDCGAVPFLAKNVNNKDVKLKRVLLSALSSMAKHSEDMAECVVEANTFPNALIHLAHADARVRRNAACLVRDVVKHSTALSQLVVNLGGIGAILEAAGQDATGEIRLPCFVALGYMAGQCDQIALSVMGCNGVEVVAQTLFEFTDDGLLSVCAWTLGQIGKHSPEHAKAVALTNAFPKLLQLYQSPMSSLDLSDKAKTCLKQCLQRCTFAPALESLLNDAPHTILKYILGQYAKILPSNPQARRLFVTSGCLKKIQEIDAEAGSTMMEYVIIINSCFPEEIVRYYSPGYSETLLELVESYSPDMVSVIREARLASTEAQTDTGIVLNEQTSSTSRDLKMISSS